MISIIVISLYVIITLRMMQVRCRPYYRKNKSRIRQCIKALFWPLVVIDIIVVDITRKIEKN